MEVLEMLGFKGWVLLISVSVMIYLILKLLTQSRYEEIDKRVENMNLHNEGSEDDKKLSESLFKRIYEKMEEKVIKLLKKNTQSGSMAPLKIKLIQSGDSDTEPIQFRAKMIIFAILAAIFGFMAGGIKMALILAALGAYYPNMKLSDAIKNRQHQIKKEIPDFLDLLAATAPSAKNLEDAIRKVCERSEGVVTNEFSKALEEVNAGRKTRDALEDMAIRCGIEEIKTLIAQINQSEVFGTGVEKTLQVQADRIRKLKKVMAEIKARKAAVTLLLPSLFLLACILIVMVGPHIVTMIDGLGELK